MRVDALQVADHVQVQRRGLDALRRVLHEPRDVRIGVRALEITEKDLLGEELLRAFQVAVQEHAHSQAQVGDQTAVQVADFQHARLGELAALVDLLLLEIGDHALDNVSDLLHVDGERDDVRPAPALLVVERLAADLREVELDRRVQFVHDIVHLAQTLRQLAVIVLEHDQHAGQHLLDDVADTHGLAHGVADGERWRGQRRRIEVARSRRIVVIGPGGHEPLGDARNRLGEKKEERREREVEQQMEVDCGRSIDNAQGAEAFLGVRQQRDRDQAADQAEQEIAQVDAPRLGWCRDRIDHRQDAAAEVRAEHQAHADVQGNHLGRHQRRRQQHDREARIGEHREQDRHQHIEHDVAGQRGEDDLHARTLRQRSGGKDDQLQREDDEAQPDQHLSEAANTLVLAAHEQRHAPHDQQGRKPGQVEGEHQRHHRGTDVRAEHHRQRRRGGDQPLPGESGEHERRRVAALDQRRDAQACGERRKPIGHALAQDTAQVAAVQTEDTGPDDVRAPHEERNTCQQIEEDFHRLGAPAASTALRAASTMSSARSSSCGAMIRGGESVTTFPWPILKDRPRARH